MSLRRRLLFAETTSRRHPWTNGPEMDPLVGQFRDILNELIAPEKRSIIALTEIARDILRTHPHLAPAVASVVLDRILEVSSTYLICEIGCFKREDDANPV